MDITYKNLNLPIYPLAKNIGDIELLVGDNIFSVNMLSKELLDFFKSKNIVLVDNFKILNSTVLNYPSTAYTDGFYPDPHSARDCAINWNFAYELGTEYIFYNIDNGTPLYDPIKNNTVWTNLTNVACPNWTTFGPILLNPQLPYAPLNNKNTENNLICLSLYFQETWKTLNTKLQDIII